MDEREGLVEDFERRIGHRLPDEYRRFLLAAPVPVWTAEESPDNPYTELLHSFYDLGVDEDRDLSARFNARGTGLPDWLLVIGEQYGVEIGLGISGPHRGRVYQWSGDDGEERELSPSFDAFLTQCREEEARWPSRRR